MHARIENKTKNKKIYTQKEWAQIIRECKEVDPYEVKEVTQKEIFEFDELNKFFNWKQAKISRIREIKIIPNNTCVSIKYDFFKDPIEVCVLKRNTNLDKIIEHKLTAAYDKPIPLKEKKKEDLTTMLNKKLIPKQFEQDFVEVLKY